MPKEINEKTVAEAYQPLFNLINKEHELTLLISEMDDIIDAVYAVNKNLKDLWRVVCDVEGCDQTACNQGTHWSDSGYWCVCSKHSSLGHKGKPKPKMKKEAIKREERRKKNPNGCLY